MVVFMYGCIYDLCVLTLTSLVPKIMSGIFILLTLSFSDCKSIILQIPLDFCILIDKSYSVGRDCFLFHKGMDLTAEWI